MGDRLQASTPPPTLLSRNTSFSSMSLISSHERRVVNPFISSTFKDFFSERDHLVKHIFPELNSLCREHRTYFAPVDLRWGINKQDAKASQALRLCLELCLESQPFFICLLGERYGW